MGSDAYSVGSLVWAAREVYLVVGRVEKLRCHEVVVDEADDEAVGTKAAADDADDGTVGEGGVK